MIGQLFDTMIVTKERNYKVGQKGTRGRYFIHLLARVKEGLNGVNR